MNLMEISRPYLTCDPCPRIPKPGKLASRDNPALQLRECGNWPVSSRFVSHSETKSEVSGIRPLGVAQTPEESRTLRGVEGNSCSPPYDCFSGRF